MMYAKRFMNFKNNSFQNIQCTFKYSQKLFIQASDIFRNRDPDQILLHPEGILVQRYPTLFLFDNNGKEIWRCGTAGRMFVSYVNNNLYTQNSNGNIKVRVIKTDSIKSQKVDLASTLSTVDLIFPLSDSLVLIQNYRARLKGGGSSHIMLMDGHWSKWRISDGDFLAPSVLYNDNKNVIISNDQGKTRDIEIITGKVLRTFTTKPYGTAQFSLDHDDNLVFIGSDKDNYGALLKYSIKGEKYWEYPLPEILKDQNYLQPSAIDSDNNIYAIIDTVLYSLDKNGKLRWSTLVFPTDKYKFQYVTVLGDNSVFIVGANRITHYDKDGKELFQKLLPVGENITTQPVVDPNGCFYFATVKGIYCYE